MVRYLLSLIPNNHPDKWTPLRQMLDSIKDVHCHICGGCGHTGKTCGTMLRIQETKRGNPPLKSCWNEIFTTMEHDLAMDNNPDAFTYTHGNGRLRGVFLPKMHMRIFRSYEMQELAAIMTLCPQFALDCKIWYDMANPVVAHQ